MDHRISKDMISSGMIPSGEKNQEDLSRTQYGTAPSPNALADVYKKMYEKKEEVINEMAGKGMGMTPAPKPQGKLPKPQDPATSKPQKDFIKARISDSPSPKTETTAVDRPKPKTETDKMLDKVSDRRVEKAVNRDKDVRRARASYIMTKYGESVDLLAAYRSVYEHHKKDADGNTIPHEGEEVKEGMGLYANIHAKRKRGGKMRKKGDKGAPSSQDFANASKTAKEEVDKFDIVVNHFLNEGYQKEDIIKAMSTVHLTEEQLLQEDFGISALIAGTAAALAKGAAVAGKVAATAGKVGMTAAKGIGTATKAVATAAKPVVGAATKGLTNVGTKVGQTAGKVGTKVSQTAGDVSQQVKKVATTAKDTVGQKIQNIAQGTGKKPTSQTPQTPQQKTVRDRVMDYGKKKGEDELMKDRPLQKTNKTGTASAKTTDIAASADLFDIVKGKLLDEGLSEEEIKDIMLTLTPDEIMEELSDIVKRNDALNRERAMKAAQERKVPDKVREASKRQYTAGGPKDKGENKYTVQDKKTIIDYNKDK